jgi:Icc-related predicted phosphoesterase
MSSLRIAVVADIHHGADSFTKKGSAALGLMDEFARFVAAAKPDLVLDLGDRISDRDHDHDLAREQEVAEAFRSIAAPVFHICGNHDRDFLSVAENAEILGQDLGNQVVDIGGWRIVLWRADSRIRRSATDGLGGFVLAEADLLWLAGVVRTADRPLAVVSHVPVSGHGQTGNYYFERNPELSTYPGAGRARAILRAATVPVMCLAGHVHWNTLTVVDGIPHITCQSLTESFTTHPAPAGAWGLLELGAAIDWQVTGLDPFAVRLDVAAAGRRWITPLPPFDQLPEIRARRSA